MSHFLSALAPPSGRPCPLASAHDAMAAELIERAAQAGNAGAEEVAWSLNAALTRSYLRRQRSGRLREVGWRASSMGYHDFAELAGLAATDEETEAMGEEAFADSVVRGTHSQFGYLSPSETKFLARKKAEESWTAQQAETVLASLLDNLYAQATNFGASDEYNPEAGDANDEFGAEHIDAVTALVRSYRGDLPLVFGDDAYHAIFGIFQASEEQLRKRQARLQKRLERLETKLEEKEDAGKTGLAVKLLTLRIGFLEKRLAKIGDKLDKTAQGKKETKVAAKDATKIKAGEHSALTSATEGRQKRRRSATQTLPDIESDLAALEDEALGAEVDVFGLSSRRAQRLARRLARLEGRLAKLSGRPQTGLLGRRIALLQGRVARLRSKLSASGSDADLDASIDAELSSIEAHTPAIPGAYSDDQWVQSFFGASGAFHRDEREPFVAYFARSAEALGVAPGEGFGAEGASGEGFFSRLGTFFRKVFVEPVKRFMAPARRDTRKGRRQQAAKQVGEKAQAYLATRRARIQRTRTARRAARKEHKPGQLARTWGEKRRGRRQKTVQAGRRGWKLLTPAVQAVRKTKDRKQIRSVRKARRHYTAKRSAGAWKRATPGVTRARKRAVHAQENVALAARAARRNNKRRGTGAGPTVLSGTDGWAFYVLYPNQKKIEYHNPKSGKLVVVRPATHAKAWNAIIEAVKFKPGSARRR